MTKAKHSTDRQAATDAFAGYLKSHRIKLTKPRRAILQAVLSIEDHFEADQLMVHLRQTGHKVAKATIYRTLPLLVDCGILRRVRLSDTQTHFKQAFGDEQYDHMLCQRCGRIIEFSSLDVHKLRTRVAHEHDFHALAHRFQISGWCCYCVESCLSADES